MRDSNGSNEEFKKKVSEQLKVAEFKKRTGIVTRVLGMCFNIGYFTKAELETALTSYGISGYELVEVLDFLEGYEIIKCRMQDSKTAVEIADVFDADFEMKLTSKGKLVSIGELKCPGIEI